MRMSQFTGLVLLLLLAAAGFGSFALQAQSTPDAERKGKPRRRADVALPADSADRVTVAVARDRAAQMHTMLESTLHAMHRHYFHRDRDRATVPARALQDVFSEYARDAHVDIRWISANTRAMSLDHEPADDFEKRAAREIAAGKPFVDAVVEGSYRRAGAIPLGGSCISCHTTSFTPPSATPRYAGLVISIPVLPE